MNWQGLQETRRIWVETGAARRAFELGLSVLFGFILGGLLVFSWGYESKWQELITVLPIAFAVVMLIGDLEKTVLATIAVGVPLNLDVSLIISPYARNAQNIARGYRTIVALTELRVSLVFVVLLIGYALWLAVPRDSGRRPIRFYPATSIPALGLLLVSILSVFQAQDGQLSFFRIVQLFEMFLTYLYLVNHIRTTSDLHFFVLVLMGGMFAESLLMIWQWSTGETFHIAGMAATVWDKGLRRVGGTLGGANAAGGVISAYLGIVCAMIWVLPKPAQKVFAVICFFAGGVALISTSSRASWGGFVGAILAFVLIGLWRGWVRRETLILLLIGAVVLGAIFYPAIHTRLTMDDHGSAESRTKMARLAWNIIRVHPWLGIGANNCALVARDYYTPDVGDLGYVIDSSVHNRYLLIWSETGLFGLLFYVGLLLSPLVQVLRHIRSGDRTRALMALGLGCAIISMSIQMLAEHFNPRPSTLFIWLLVSLATSLNNLKLTSVQPATSGHALGKSKVVHSYL